MNTVSEIFRNMMVGDLMNFNPFDAGEARAASKCVGRRMGRSYEVSENSDGTIAVKRRS